MRFRPRDQWGRINCISADDFSWAIVWEWPKGKMAWFFWNWGGSYRLGPLTLSFQAKELNAQDGQ